MPLALTFGTHSHRALPSTQRQEAPNPAAQPTAPDASRHWIEAEDTVAGFAGRTGGGGANTRGLQDPMISGAMGTMMLLMARSLSLADAASRVFFRARDATDKKCRRGARPSALSHSTRTRLLRRAR